MVQISVYGKEAPKIVKKIRERSIMVEKSKAYNEARAILENFLPISCELVLLLALPLHNHLEALALLYCIIIYLLLPLGLLQYEH